MGKGGKGSGKKQNPNDDRSNSLNPNNPAHQATLDNKTNQLNPDHPKHKGPGKDADKKEK